MNKKTLDSSVFLMVLLNVAVDFRSRGSLSPRAQVQHPFLLPSGCTHGIFFAAGLALSLFVAVYDCGVSVVPLLPPDIE
ncbi:hypothetical protein [Bacillus marinisedimentorum]|uniref:hypothetical protein n=1 Tax=Bacillus marinisedimentorum TaxID=1821260 RepID=UPI0008726389|nr:hypothetical protein [Bacillus marinisedimentorum]